MTCIIGLVDDGHVVMGADSASASGWAVRPTLVPKLFRVGEFLIGYTTSFRMGQILQYHLEPGVHEDGTEDEEYMVTKFIPAVRRVLRRHGFAKSENNVETGGLFLVGYRSRVYRIGSDFQVNSFADGFDAIGAGEEFALGAMAALEELPPRFRVRRSLEVAAHFSGCVCGPFKLMRCPSFPFPPDIGEGGSE